MKRLLALYLPLLVAVTSCSGDGGSGPTEPEVVIPTIASVEIATHTGTMIVGHSQRLSATVRKSDGAVATDAPVSWSTSSAAVATVDGQGVVTAMGAGSAKITATSSGRKAEADVTVVLPPVASVTVSPAGLSGSVGQVGQLTATLQDASGNVLTGRNITWSSGNDSVATVSSSGLVTATGVGTTKITATAEGKSGEATIVVASAAVATIELSPSALTGFPGESGRITATTKDAAGNVLTGRTITWSSDAANVASVSNDGVVFALSPGTAHIMASSEGRSAVATVVVQTPTNNVCTAIAGASVVANNGTYLGRLTNKFDSQSVMNEFGTYGSKYSSNSIWNEFGNYGSPYASQSAFNPYTNTPPALVKNGAAIAFLTVNTLKTPAVNPNYLKTCSFP